ncbi:MAG: zinc-dependent peptidase [Synechocystis sp.]
MIPTTLVILLVLGIIAYIWGYPLWWQWREAQLGRQAIAEEWQALFNRTLPFYPGLSPGQKQRLHAKIQLFLQQKQFIACQGFCLTDTVRLTIAAQACYLALNLGSNPYPRLDSILVYPDAFQVKQIQAVDQYLWEERQVPVSGESWGKAGQVILAWGTIAWDLERWQDGHNVIFHEFAHQLDIGDGAMNGVPKLAKAQDYQRWRSVFTAEYQQLLSQLEHRIPTTIDPYGATNPAEFFAVVTETFLEKGPALHQNHPQLYEILHQYYQLRPIAPCSLPSSPSPS